MTSRFRTVRLAAAIAAMGLLAAGSAIAAPMTLTTGDRITLGYGSGADGNAWRGGEFLVTGFSVAQGIGDSFLTFCLEYNEHFTPGGQFYVRLNTGAVSGGVSTVGFYAGDVDGTSNFDPLSKATKWLYTQFMTNPGALGYDLSGGNTRTSAVNQPRNDSFQLAVWRLEGELSPTVSSGALTAYNNDTRAQNWVALAIAQSATWTDPGNVGVMNLFTNYDAATGTFSGPGQDQLYMRPVPEPGALGLLAVGLAGAAFARRRRAQVV